MSAVKKTEVAPGLVVYLLPETLRDSDDCLTNAAESDIVEGKRPFIVLENRPDLGGFLCVPLYSNEEAIGLLPVDEKAKGGPKLGWTDVTSYFHPDQFWIIPASLFAKASFGVEYSGSGKRKSFGKAKPSARKAIASHCGDAPFRHMPISN